MAAGSLTRRPVLAAAVVYACAALAMGWPVVASIGTRIASDPGDPLLNAAILAWNATHVPWTDAWFQFPIFHPTRDALTLSEHLLGLSVVASPVYWLTGSPAIAYNVTLLLTYPLCGLAMYALVCRLTRSSAAAFVSGLAFAFTPYRASQLPHIQMLAMFWAPLALLGLHAFAENGVGGHLKRTVWLALFAVCWALQGAANGYMLVHFSVLAAGWGLWFLVARRRWRDAVLVAGAAVIALLPLLPVLYRYATTRRELGLSRNLGEIASFSADLAAPLCAAPVLTVWGWMRTACGPEGELFPGLTPVAFCAAAVLILRRRERRTTGDRIEGGDHISGAAGRAQPRRAGTVAVRRVVMRIAFLVALLFLAVAASSWLIGPWRIDLGWLRASASSADKPLSTALAMLLLAALLSDRLRTAVGRGSVLTFYAAAAAACWVLAWGPFPRLFGVPVLYQAPYAWLLQLPAVDALRVPARFWMLTMLCLSVAAGLLMAQLLRGRSPRAALAIVALVSAGLLVDGWASIPAVPLPSPVANAAVLRGAPVLVAPVGDLFRDAATVYDAVAHGWRTINGYSGYEPGYYQALRTLSEADSPAQYQPFLERGDIVVVDARGVRRLTAQRADSGNPRPSRRRLDAVVTAASCSTAEARFAADRDVETLWICGLQDADQQITVDVARVHDVTAVGYALGSAGAAFPRHLVIETSRDAATWDAAWEGGVAAMVVAAAMDEPRQTRLVIPFPSRPARFVRLRQTGRDGRSYWSIAEIEVWSATSG